MTSSILQVIIKVSKQGTGDKEAARQAKELKGVLNELGLGSLATMGYIGLLVAAVGTFTKVTADAVDGTVKYANEVRTLKLLTGESAEETSRTIQVMDDFKIKTDALTMAQKTLSKDGLSLNLETLAKLSDEYKKLGTGAEKTRFLVEKFGKTGLVFAEAMEKGGDALLHMGAAVDKHLLLTEEQLQQSRDYELALDSLNEKWEGLSRTIGVTAIPTLTRAVSMTDSLAQSIQENIDKDGILISGYKILIDFMTKRVAVNKEEAAAKLESAAATTALGDAALAAAPSEEELAAAAKDLSDSLKGQLGLMFDLQGETDKFRDKEEQLRVKMAELSAQLEKDPSNENLQKDLQNTRAELEQNAVKHEEASRRIIYSMLQTQLASDGLTQAEFDALTKIGEQWGLLDENVASQARSISQSIERYMQTGDLDAFNNAIERTMKMPPSKTITVAVNTVYSTTGKPTTATQNLAVGYAEGTGGWMQVPPGFPNDSYPVGLSSGEKFAVVPAGEGQASGGMSSASGGGLTLILEYKPLISLGDQAELNERLMPAIREGVRQLMNGR